MSSNASAGSPGGGNSTLVPKDHISVFGNKKPSKYADPCAHAAKASMKCLEDNNYNRDKCLEIFENYRECKKTWMTQRRQDRREGKEGAFD